MKDRKTQILLGLVFVGMALGLLLWAAWTPVQAGAGLPSRDTPTPTRDASRDDDDDDNKGSATPVGAYIVLQTTSSQAGTWSAVQWQDNNGDWQTVEGWQGPLPVNNRWWVAAKDFKTGPFRWAILNGPGGEILSASTPFNLPGQANETLFVNLDKP